MRFSELLRLVMTNLLQNKFKVILTSVGIVVGAATIVMVIAIGTGGKLDVEEQFKNLNAGAIDISYEQSSSSSGSGGGSQGGFPMPNAGGGAMPNMGGGSSSGGGSSRQSGGSSGRSGSSSGGSFGGFGGMDFGSMFGGSGADSRINRESISLSEEDVDTIETFVPGISEVTISCTTKSEVEGGELSEAESYTVAGVKSEYGTLSNLSLEYGEFITDDDDENKNKVCVLGAATAKAIFGSAYDAYDSTLYIDGRQYVVNGVLASVGSVTSGISPDDAVFIPYETCVKYLTGADNSATITVIASDLTDVDGVKANIETVLAESYPNAEFTFEDTGSKMDAASASNNTLTMLLIAMAAIVFIVGGIGIMNVLFVSVKERTNEIGILKAIGCTKKNVLTEFLLEACFISVIGGILGIALSLAITPLVELMGVRVELSALAGVLALAFAVFTGTVFGFYPAYKASKLVPVEALNHE